MDREVVEIPLTSEERTLLLRYGYPFERVEQALKAGERSAAVEIVPLDLFELERLIGDLSITINDSDGGNLQGQLLDLCERLEAIKSYPDSLLGEF